jgi:hypothetical protein
VEFVEAGALCVAGCCVLFGAVADGGVEFDGVVDCCAKL